MATPTTRDGGASARIAEGLRADILRGALPPGTRIRQEDIAERFGASRLPVREALRVLETAGLVTLVANTGAWVAQLSLAECDEIYQVRERIEPLLLRMSAPFLDAPVIARLDELAKLMEAGSDVEELLRLDREFHLLSYSGGTTMLLGASVKGLWDATQHYRRAFALLLDGDGNRVLHDEHHMLVSALRSADIDEAERVLYGHIRRTRLQLGRHPEIFQTGSPTVG